MRPVMIFSGHSGGHLFPALAFAEIYKEQSNETAIHLVTGKKGKRFLNQSESVFDQVHYLGHFPAPRKISWNTVVFTLKLVGAFFICAYLLLRHRPKLVLGFGSYISFPGVLLARFVGIPTLIHEQNLEPGMATRLLASWVDCVALSFEETLREHKTKRRAHVGLPLRKRFLRTTMPEPPMGGRKFQLLVMGGSQGAKSLNQLVLGALSALDSGEKSNLVVNHITGDEDKDWVQSEYQKLGIQAQVFGFYQEMEKLYQVSDLVISRAGANSLFECAYFGLPSIVIPYPHAEAHQKRNAQYFAERHAICLMEQGALDADKLISQIRQLWQQGELRSTMTQSQKVLAKKQAGAGLVQLSQEVMQ